MELYGSEVPLIPPSPTDESDAKNDSRPEKAAPVGEFEKAVLAEENGEKIITQNEQPTEEGADSGGSNSEDSGETDSESGSDSEGSSGESGSESSSGSEGSETDDSPDEQEKGKSEKRRSDSRERSRKLKKKRRHHGRHRSRSKEGRKRRKHKRRHGSQKSKGHRRHGDRERRHHKEKKRRRKHGKRHRRREGSASRKRNGSKSRSSGKRRHSERESNEMREQRRRSRERKEREIKKIEKRENLIDKDPQKALAERLAKVRQPADAVNQMNSGEKSAAEIAQSFLDATANAPIKTLTASTDSRPNNHRRSPERRYPAQSSSASHAPKGRGPSPARSPKKERRREYDRMSPPPRDDRSRNRDENRGGGGGHSRGSGTSHEYRDDRHPPPPPPPPQSHRDGGERSSDRYHDRRPREHRDGSRGRDDRRKRRSSPSPESSDPEAYGRFRPGRDYSGGRSGGGSRNKQSKQDWKENQLRKDDMLRDKVKKETGIAIPEYYKASAVNPEQFAEQEKKRKLLWSKKESNKTSTIWGATSFSTDGSNEKFRRLMGIKEGEAGPETKSELDSGVATKIAQKQDELFKHLDQQYAVARLQTHTQRGSGLGFNS